MVLWLVNYYVERAALPDLIVERRPETMLSLVALSVLNIVVLCYSYTRTSQMLKDYMLRVQVAAVSPKLLEPYSMASPLIYGVRDLLRVTPLAFALVSFNSLMAGLSLSVLLVGAFHWFGVSMWLVASDPVLLETLMNLWAKRFLFYGVNAGLFWILVVWSALSSLRIIRMHRVLERSYEEQMRDLAAKYPSPLT